MNTVSTNPGSYVDWNENPAKKKQNPTCLQKYPWINTCMQWQWIIIMIIIMIIIIILSRADILLTWDEIVLLEKKANPWLSHSIPTIQSS